MDAVFLKLFHMSMTAGWLILAVIVFRLLLKKAPKWLSCVLWVMVAFRLLCPVAPESSLSLIPGEETLSSLEDRYGKAPVLDSGIPSLNNTLNPVLGELLVPAPGTSVNPLQIIMYLAGMIWTAGLFALLIYALASLWRIHRSVREAVFLRDNVWLCDEVKSPFILGVIRPRIYLPSGINEEQMKYVLAHEETHLKRKDHWWKLLGFGLLAVYWFHPLVWAAYILFCRDIELACDEKVIKKMNMDGKKAYSRALVDSSVHRRVMLACPLAFGEVGVKERVKNVLHYKKCASWMIAAAVLGCAAVAVCFLTNPKKDFLNIRIVIPAGSEAESDDRSSYVTPGMPVMLNAKKGAWYKIGVAVSNPTDQDIVVYVRVKGVQERIGDAAVDIGWNKKYVAVPSATEKGKYYFVIENGSDVGGGIE